ncbi:MAG: tetratricopeptide repeat protein [Crocinitomix sp.]|nr:tetratricopeptide repeat protein [Crocinitomix sp.]
MKLIRTALTFLCFLSWSLFAQNECVLDFQEKYNQGEYQAAIKVSESCTEINEDSELLHFKTRSYMYLADYEKAIPLYYKLLSFDSTNLDYLNGLGAAYFESSQNDSAFYYYSIVLKEAPNHENALLNRRLLYMLDKQYEKALIDIKKLTELFPSNSEFWVDLGDAYYLTDEDDLSLLAYDKALELDPENSDAFLGKADTYLYLDNYEQALFNVNKGIALNKNNPLLYATLGDIYYYQDDDHSEEALNAYIRSFKLEKDPDIAYCIGICHEDLGDLENAVKYYQKAIDLGSDDPDCYSDLAYLIYRQEPLKATELFNKAITLDPESAYTYGLAGDILFAVFAYENAIKCYTNAIKFSASFKSYNYRRGLVYDRLRDYDAAISDYTVSISKKRKVNDSYSARSNIYMEQGNYELAKADLDELMTFGNGDDQSYMNRSICHYKMGDLNDACDDMATASYFGNAEAASNVQKYCNN